MKPITLSVPTINDEPYSVHRLSALWRQVIDDNLDVTLDFSGCTFLGQNAVAFLGGLTRRISSRNGHCQFRWTTLGEKVRTNLMQNGFVAAMANQQGGWDGNSIPYREDLITDPESLMDYLRTRWLGRGWVNVSQALCDAVVGKVYEIYSNAFEHGRSKIGLFSCGQHFPKKRYLKLSVVDFGVGIPANVRGFLNEVNLPPQKAMEWAFQPGTTTQPGGLGRGMGLDLLRQLVRLNKGQLSVQSHDGHAIIDRRGERYAAVPNFFEGTLVNITLVCDDQFYYLASEVPSESPF